MLGHICSYCEFYIKYTDNGRIIIIIIIQCCIIIIIIIIYVWI